MRNGAGRAGASAASACDAAVAARLAVAMNCRRWIPDMRGVLVARSIANRLVEHPLTRRVSEGGPRLRVGLVMDRSQQPDVGFTHFHSSTTSGSACLMRARIR